MTESFTVRDARTRLAELITAAESGTPAVITRNGTPAAVLVSIDDSTTGWRTRSTTVGS